MDISEWFISIRCSEAGTYSTPFGLQAFVMMKRDLGTLSALEANHAPEVPEIF